MNRYVYGRLHLERNRSLQYEIVIQQTPDELKSVYVDVFICVRLA